MKILIWILSILILNTVQAKNFNIQNLVKAHIKSMNKIPGGGGIDGGGGDLVPYDFGSAWFLNDDVPRTIRSCIIKDRINFPLEDDFIVRNIHEAFTTWENYITKVDLYNDLSDESDNVKIRLVTNITISPTCNGDEDLIFYLGVQNDEIERLRSKFNNPMAFAHRFFYDKKLGWGKGLVWLVGNYAQQGDHVERFYWSANNNFKAILLHEIGHILGVSHKRGTIMAENVTTFFAPYDMGTDYFLNKYLDKIDWFTVLYSGFQFLDPDLWRGMWLAGTEHEKESFKLLMDRDPVGKVQTQLLYSQQNAKQNLDIQFVVNDDLNSKQFPITFNIRQITVHEDVDKIFYRIRLINDPNDEFLTRGLENVYLSSLVGVLKKKDQKEINILLENGFSSWIILPPEGEPDLPLNEAYVNEGAFSIFAIEKGKKYYLYSDIKKYEW